MWSNPMAFNPNLPLRGSNKKDNTKAIDKKPLEFGTPNLDKIKKRAEIRTQESGASNNNNNNRTKTKIISEDSSESSSSSDSSSSVESSSSSEKPKEKRKFMKSGNKGSNNNRKRGSLPGTGSDGYSPRMPKSANYKGKDNGSESQKNTAGRMSGYLESGPIKYFKSPVRSNFTLNEFQTANYPVSGEMIPKVFFNVCSLAKGIAQSGTYSYNFFTEIYARYNLDVLHVARTSTLTTSWNLANFITYISNLLQALECYVTVKSILAFLNNQSKLRDKNMTAINYCLQFNDYSIIAKVDFLEKSLKGFWLPPKLVDLTVWLYSWKRISELEQSALARFMPDQSFINDSVYTFSVTKINAYINICLGFLQDVNNQNISVALTSVYPDGRMSHIPIPSGEANYDTCWQEIFANQVNLFTDELNTNSISVYPFSISTSIVDIPYFVNRKPEEVDGIALALSQQALGTAYGTGSLGTLNATAYTSAMLLPLNCVNMASDNKGNKYTLDQSLTCQRRFIYNYIAGSDDCNYIIKLTSNYSAISVPQAGWQRVYYDTKISGQITTGYLMDWLFNLSVAGD